RQPWTLGHFAPVLPAAFVVPAAVLWELDRLMEDTRLRDRVRAVRNVLRDLVDRGALTTAVSVGQGATLQVISTQPSAAHPDLDPALADDRILASALHLSEGRNVTLAT